MNDSFLEDLELVPVEQKTGSAVNEAEKYITTRRHRQSITTGLCPDRNELESLIREQQKQHKSATVLIKTSSGKKSSDDHSPSKDMYSKRKPVDPKDKIQLELKKVNREHKTPIKSRINEKKLKVTVDKLKPLENVERPENLKSSLSSTEEKKRPTSKENSRLSDGSSKENSRPSESSVEPITNTEVTKEWRKISGDNIKKKGEINENHSESVHMLNAIKEIVSSYTKMESNKIMKMMQDHYINSQANFMKQLLILTDDLHQSYPNKESSRIQTLIQENTRLMENISFLKNRIDELQKICDATEKIRQENIALKLKIHELEK
ncbi:hypothetical protein PV327_006668 [Microctonus hyperodae]|uniref:Uncharacterized protein n=1 Tax=Microctonus hyperodae TaxID=165561 RepID=A0AA39KIR9_MICHY|nr:hypothetical protein PV327_006668 [Microctonus hyperodae]